MRNFDNLRKWDKEGAEDTLLSNQQSKKTAHRELIAGVPKSRYDDKKEDKDKDKDKDEAQPVKMHLTGHDEGDDELIEAHHKIERDFSKYERLLPEFQRLDDLRKQYDDVNNDIGDGLKRVVEAMMALRDAQEGRTKGADIPSLQKAIGDAEAEVRKARSIMGSERDQKAKEILQKIGELEEELLGEKSP